MTSFMVLDGVMSYLCLKDVTNTCKRVRHSPTILAGVIQYNGESWKKLKTSDVFWSFIVC